jgi:hypothetical protein
MIRDIRHVDDCFGDLGPPRTFDFCRDHREGATQLRKDGNCVGALSLFHLTSDGDALVPRSPLMSRDRRAR